MNTMTPPKSDDILAESFRIIEAEVGSHSFDAGQWPIVRRMIHASGDLDLVPLVRFHNHPVRAALEAFSRHAPIVTDVTMVSAGIHQPFADRLGVVVRCYLNDPGVEQQAKQRGTTRSACGLERGIAQLGDAVYVIGNAPTALLALCAAVRQERVRPALIVAMPVGFVAVDQSKEEALTLPVPVITVLGRKGGSALAAAAVNALLCLGMERTGHDP
jgi:precorrin-8X/cobalt-precorrin-8 methylmutase